MAIYVAEDGNWGDAERLVILPENITDEQCFILSDSSDADRLAIAVKILLGESLEEYIPNV